MARFNKNDESLFNKNDDKCVCQILKGGKICENLQFSTKCFHSASKKFCTKWSKLLLHFQEIKTGPIAQMDGLVRKVTLKFSHTKKKKKKTNLVLQVTDKETCFTAKYFC